MTDHTSPREIVADYAEESIVQAASVTVTEPATPYYADDHITLYHGQAAATLAELPAASVDCIVTSPPYWGLRDYGVDGQLGLEETPAEFVANLVEVFREAHRVLADDGTLFVNLGDTYASKARGSDAGWEKSRLTNPGGTQKAQAASMRKTGERHRGKRAGIAEKNLIGIPWRVAFALQDDGWILRSDIVWDKPNAMPESVTDRFASRHEYVFMLTKSPRYWFDLDAVRVPQESRGDRHEGRSGYRDEHPSKGGITKRALHPLGRNPGDVWAIPTTPFPEAHFAVYPTALAARCIQAGCRPGGTVLDPFSGSGTTGLAATELGRSYVGIELKADYLDLSLRTRLRQGVLNLGQ